MFDIHEPTEFAVVRAADVAEGRHATGDVVKLEVDHVGQFEHDFLRSDHPDVLRVECAGSFSGGLASDTPGSRR